MKFTNVDSSVFYSSESSKERIDWPFKNMKVGDCVEFEAKDAKHAQKYAHTYADKAVNGARFKTKKVLSGKMLIIRVM